MQSSSSLVSTVRSHCLRQFGCYVQDGVRVDSSGKPPRLAPLGSGPSNPSQPSRNS
jgi:hypothetical protein